MLPLPPRESLTVEFKSDHRQRLSDTELVEALVCLANAEGGELYLGVEDDGHATGLHASRPTPDGLPAMIANHTRPPLAVRVEPLIVGELPVLRIVVPKAQQVVATSKGVSPRRRLDPSGKPECVPMFPQEFPARLGDLGVLDYSALPLEAASEEDFDPVERARLRRFVDIYRGDQALLPLNDGELDEALGLVTLRGGRRVPTVTGLLILGQERALRAHLPTHEVAFQVLDGTEVRVNPFFRFPLLRTFEYLSEQFDVRYEERELDAGLFRVPVPNFDRRAFREALANALIHRDYARMGAVHMLWENDGISLSNPGGLVEGVTLENLLTVRPTPRNPLLADALKRIGLAERTARGVDRIFEGMLRYGRPAPDYSATTSASVSVKLHGGEADLQLLRVILDEERRRGSSLPLETLIIISALRRERRLDTASLAHAIQKTEPATRTVLERLVESGLVEAHGVNRGRNFMLSSKVYRELGQSASYVRQVGFDRIQQEQMILNLVHTKGQIKRGDVVDLCRLSPEQATTLLGRLVTSGKLVREGEKRWTVYRLGNSL